MYLEDRTNCKIIIIGNEVLDGQVHETNAFWMIKRLTEMGGIVRKVIYIEDDIQAIAKEIRYETVDNCRILITSGGLGPTNDDITLAGISGGLEIPLKINEEALSMISYRYRKLLNEGKTSTCEITEPRKKMSYLPESAIPLYNNEGTAPGVCIKLENILIAALPGVPDELKYIFDTTLMPFLKNILPLGIEKVQKSINLSIEDESLIAEKLTKVRENYKDLYIKSKPGKEKTGYKVEIVITGIGKREKIEKEIEEVINYF
jgi:nicotinamide-nucleotide amidase